MSVTGDGDWFRDEYIVRCIRQNACTPVRGDVPFAGVGADEFGNKIFAAVEHAVEVHISAEARDELAGVGEAVTVTVAGYNAAKFNHSANLIVDKARIRHPVGCAGEQ